MIECYFFSHETPPVGESEALGLLNPQEVSRANQFLHPRPRREYLLTRGALRKLLSLKLGGPPETFQFHHNAAGKPFIENCDLHFNVSHSHGLSLIGFRNGGPIGVDVEPVKDLASRESLARRWFHSAEVDQLQRSGWDPRAFFIIWTAKEAVVKALGTGLGFGMDEVWIHLDSGNRPALKQLGKSREIPEGWVLESKSLLNQQIASVAYLGPPSGIVWRELGNP